MHDTFQKLNATYENLQGYTPKLRAFYLLLTLGLSFNVQGLYQLSYLDRLLFCHLNLGVYSSYPSVVCVCGVRGAGWYMYAGCYKAHHTHTHTSNRIYLSKLDVEATIC